MKQSNGYVIFYTVALTVICGVALAVAALGLKPYQEENKSLEKKQNILATVMEIKSKEEAIEIYDKRVKSYVIDSIGNLIPDVTAEQVDVVKEYKKAGKDRKLPVYEIRNEKDSSKTDYFVFPVYGKGLWNDIWGYVSLKADMNTINGVTFDHLGETPGLGDRIKASEIQQRYAGKEIFEGNAITSVTMMKGEGNDYSKDKHKVDGMSGATLTGKGVNEMLSKYLGCYEQFIKAKMKENK